MLVKRNLFSQIVQNSFIILQIFTKGGSETIVCNNSLSTLIWLLCPICAKRDSFKLQNSGPDRILNRMVPVLFWIQNCLEIGLSLGQILENQVFLKPFEN